MKEILKISFLLLLVTALAVSCQDDDENTCCDPTNPECPNYDPCWDNEEPNASFFTEDRLIWPEFGEYLWINDSILMGGQVRFRSPFEGPGVSHVWYVGAETLTTPTVERNFSQVPRPSFITVSHVITYPIDSLCYPEATGRDSVAQTFYLIDFMSELLTVESTFRGVINNETDSFDFKIRCLDFLTGEPAQTTTSALEYYGINFHNNHDSIQFPPSTATNTHFSIYDPDLRGALLVIDPEDMSVEMNYKFFFDPTEYTFKGRVLPE
ncbi:MAG: hypothetical protein LC664_02625 [Flavobacteriales bacterium]|nr:hypothetical protein [Flavobacteriales bacterium]